ncbi:A24 family peptidase [Paenibacillus silviterrae]|uniref:A24 family peptidase n=1 Tax=Paenibacillus silviterrae TaxID=3242194 RepID=UPI002543F657|nr:A24 family peptidase [Paenibacillus chinjuensis]
MIAYGVAGALIIIAFYSDIRTRKISNGLTVTCFVLGLLVHLYLSGFNGLLFSLLGAAAGFVPMLMLYMTRAVGAGDVKLFAALGALIGTEMTLQLVFASLMAAGIVALLILLWRKEMVIRGQRLLFSMFRIGVLHDREELRDVVRADGYLRFPFMWAVLPASIGLYFHMTG